MVSVFMVKWLTINVQWFINVMYTTDVEHSQLPVDLNPAAASLNKILNSLPSAAYPDLLLPLTEQKNLPHSDIMAYTHTKKNLRCSQKM